MPWPDVPRLSPRFPDIVRRLRQARGLTQTQLAAQMGVPQQHVSVWERGLRPSRFVSLDRLAQILGVDVGQFLERPLRPAGPGVAPVLRMARAYYGWSRGQVAARSGLTPERLGRLEAGAPPDPDELARLARVLDGPELRPVADTLRQAAAR